MMHQSPELESEVLASCLAYGEPSYRPVSTILEAIDFHTERNQVVWAMLAAVDNAGLMESGDLNAQVTALSREVSAEDIIPGKSRELAFEVMGGFSAVAEISSHAYKRDVTASALRVREGSIERRLAGNLHWASQQAQESGKSAGAVLDQLIGRTDELRARSSGGTLADCSAAEAPDYTGQALSWGIGKLDDYCPLVPGRTITIGARPGCGKSSIGYWLLNRAVRDTRQPCILSMELPGPEIRREMIRRFTMPDRELAMIHVSDGKHDALQVGRRIKAWGASGLNLAVIDYIQKIQAIPGTKAGIFDRIDTAMQEIQMAGRWNGVCSVVLAQLNRCVDKTGADKEPEMSDLKGCGSIEELSDVVILPRHVPKDGESSNSKTVRLQLLIKKNRHGPQGAVWVEWEKSTGKFRQSQSWADEAEKPTPVERDIIGQEPDDEREDLFA